LSIYVVEQPFSNRQWWRSVCLHYMPPIGYSL
jgi:hypothetical protein